MRDELPARRPRAAAARSLVSLLVATAASGCGGEPLFELAGADAFAGHEGARRSRAFDVLAADMDQDGDPDLLVNWHHLAPMELFRNDGGRFVMLNAPGRDRTGLYDNDGIASLFADADAMRSRIETAGQRGLYVWHDVDRRGSWRFWWKGDGKEPARLAVELVTSLSFEGVEGLEPGEVAAPDELTRAITLDRGPGDFGFAARAEQVTTRLHVTARSPAGEPLPLYAGLDLRPCAGGEVELWKPDPHGIAWVDVEGSARPELFVTRGGLQGELSPSTAPKLDRYYVATAGGEPPYEMAGAATLPPDRGRGRAVEWVDVDNDGRLELAVTAKDTPNKLLRRDGGQGPFRDVARELGADLTGAEVQCFGDHDGDGWQDLYYLEGRTVRWLRNRGGTGFEPAASLGVALPDADPLSTKLFNYAALRLCDFDADGDLDLWVLMFGDDRTNHVFLRDGEHFVNATERSGVGAVRENIFAVLCDVDNDGFEDVVSNGSLRGQRTRAVVWRNRGGVDFAFEEVAALPKDVHIATRLDADGDGRTDLACMGTERYLLRNATERHSWIDVALRSPSGEPVGALVRVFFADGRVIARRYGSAHNSAYSQVLGPLRFGVADGAVVDRVAVRWPGERSERNYSAPSPGRMVHLEK